MTTLAEQAHVPHRSTPYGSNYLYISSQNKKPHNPPLPDMTLPLSTDLALPDYEIDDAQELPLYSAQASSSECLLQFEPAQRTGCPACEWIFASKHLKVNLGRKMWKLNSPAYGLYGTIDGSIQLTDPIESIQATIEGCIKMACPGSIDACSIPFLMHTIPIPLTPDATESTFSVPFPATFVHDKKKVQCPPSCFYAESGCIFEVAYCVRFDATWKVKKRRKTESRTVGFYYLPKTTPVIPPISVLPPASRHCENPPLFLQGPDRMKCLPIPPSFQTKRNPTSCQLKKVEQLRNAIYFSIPSPTTFTAGQEIPFMLSLSFPTDPCMAEILCESIAIHLYKRLSFHGTGTGRNTSSRSDDKPPVAERNILVSSATLRKNSGWAEGVIVLKGEISAGSPGAESSWSVPGVASVKHILRMSLRPPANLASHIPVFIHEEEVEICTSSWGAVDREIISAGGSTTPAVGLSSTLRAIY